MAVASAVQRVTGGKEGMRTEEVCVVPVGWRRESVQGRIVYFSPSQSVLWSHADLLTYLTTDGTCKCGLSCPLHVHKVFNFDPGCSLQRYASLSHTDSNQNHPHLCNQHRKLQTLSHYRTMLKTGAGHQELQSDHSFHMHQQQQLMQTHVLTQEQSDQEQMARRQEQADRMEHFSNLLQQHKRQLDARSPHVNALTTDQQQQQPLQLQQQHFSLVHDASQQQLVVNPGEVNGREVVTGYVNGTDTQMHQQLHNPQHAHQQQLQHLQHMSHLSAGESNRQQLHDVTAVTASITELIPSVGHLMPQVQMQHHHQAAHQHHPVQYSLILPQQIPMLLSPQIVSSFAPAISPSYQHHQPQQQQHQQPQLQQQQHFSQQILYDTTTSTATDLVKHRSRRKRASNKKVRTVAAILNLST